MPIQGRYLTEPDHAWLQRLRRSGTGKRGRVAPRARRRRVVGGGGGGTPGTPLLSGVLYKMVPARGIAEDAVLVETWNGTWFDAAEEDEDGELPYYVAINRIRSIIRGSFALPTYVWGIPRTISIRRLDENGNELGFDDKPGIEIVHYCMSSLVGHTTQTPQAKPQGPYHPHGEDGYRVDGGPCVIAS